MNEYYTKITRSEYINFKENVEPLDFTKSEIEYLTSKTILSKNTNISSLPFSKGLHSYENSISKGFVLHDTKNLHIYKLPDEWFVILIEFDVWLLNTEKEIYYKCDQFEGLIQLLNDL